MTKPININREQLVKLYVTKEMSVPAIAAYLGCDRRTVHRFMKNFEIESRKGTSPILYNISEEDIIDLYVKKGKSLSEISNIYGCSIGVVQNRMKKYGIDRRSPTKKIIIQKETLIDLYITQQMTAHTIANLFGCSNPTILTKLREHDIDIRTTSEARMQEVTVSKAELTKLYVNQEMSAIAIAKQLGYNTKQIAIKLEEYGIKRVRSVIIDKETLIDLYIEKKMDTHAIGRLLDCSKTTILNKMKEYGIETRTNSESRKHPRPEHRFNINEKTLIDLYVTQKLSAEVVGEKLGCSGITIAKRLKEYGIHVRSIQEANKDNKNKIPIEKDKLQRLYHDERLSARGIAKKLDRTCTWVMSRLKEHGIETRSISEANSGEYSPAWQGGIGYLPYCHKFNNKFKEKIRDRDNRTCQLCGKTEQEELEDLNRRLSVHHIHYDKENCFPDVITLCSRCNLKVNYNRDKWGLHFTRLLAERGLLQEQKSKPLQQTLEQSTKASS